MSRHVTPTLTPARVRYLERKAAQDELSAFEEIEWGEAVRLAHKTFPATSHWILEEGVEVDAETEAAIARYEEAWDDWWRTPVADLVFPTRPATVYVPPHSLTSARRRKSRRTHTRRRRARSPGRREADDSDLADSGGPR